MKSRKTAEIFRTHQKTRENENYNYSSTKKLKIFFFFVIIRTHQQHTRTQTIETKANPHTWKENRSTMLTSQIGHEEGINRRKDKCLLKGCKKEFSENIEK